MAMDGVTAMAEGGATATQRQQKAQQRHDGDGNDGNNGGKDDGDGWHDGNGQRNGNTMATRAMDGGTAHNW